MKELQVLSSIFMLLGGLVHFSLPLEYILEGTYFAIPSTNLVFTFLTLVGCVTVLKGMLISGGILGLIVGPWMANEGEFFTYRVISGEFVFVGGLIAVLVGLIKIREFKK